MIDHDGYPTEETLSKIAAFDPRKDDVIAFTEYLCQNWVNGFEPEWDREQGTLKLSTGGWSGCESVIAALRRGNEDGIAWYWMMFWHSSRRGGHYEFRDIRNMTKKEKK